MQSKVNYTAVGIFVVTLSIFLVIGIFWLTGITNQKGYHMYHVYMHEDVGGLTIESPVRFSGVKVGFVKSIKLDENNSRLVRIKLAIEPKIKITTSTYATLNMQGITGVEYVNLKAETENAPLLTAAPGQKIPVIAYRPSFLMQLSTVLPEVATEIKSLSSSVSKLLDDENRQSLKNTLKNLSTGTKTFSYQLIPNADQAILNFSIATQNINRLTEELEENPSILVRGKRPVAKGPGE